MQSPEHKVHRSTQLIVRNSTFNVLGMALIVPLNFVALFTLARRLGQEPLGVFFTLFAISAVIFLICSAGVGTVLSTIVALVTRGEAAAEWMRMAQCFAGPPEDPPAPGSRAGSPPAA